MPLAMGHPAAKACPLRRSGSILIAEPFDGAAELTELYERLNPIPGAEPFEPHITLGLFDTPMATPVS